MNWRANKCVLVTAANSLGAIAVIRSLGKAGYRILACAGSPNALGFHSSYCQQGIVEPSNALEFFTWLDQLILDNNISLIIPSEGFLLRVRERFSKYQHLLPVPADKKLIYAGLSKYDLFEKYHANGLTENLPPFLLIDENVHKLCEQSLHGFEWPVFLKLDSSYALVEPNSKVIKCKDYNELSIAFEKNRPIYHKMLIQGFVAGVGIGAFLCQWKNVELANFMHRRLHEVPHTGGASSYRCGWEDPIIMADAHARMQCLGWNGVGMFEYRWNPATQKFYLLEFNSRFWGSLHLALFAGVDFPRLLTDAFYGFPDTIPLAKPHTRSRVTFPGELGYMMSYLRDSSISKLKRMFAVIEFFLLSLNPKVKADLWYPGDRKLYFIAAYRALVNILR